MLHNQLVHHHLLIQADTKNVYLADDEYVLKQFMYDLLKVIDMECLIAPVFKFSEYNAWTGIMGIVTSHIAFHHRTDQRYLQFDIYSCKPFDHEKATAFINDFRRTYNVKKLFIDRQHNDNFKVDGGSD